MQPPRPLEDWKSHHSPVPIAHAYAHSPSLLRHDRRLPHGSIRLTKRVSRDGEEARAAKPLVHLNGGGSYKNGAASPPIHRSQTQ
jgi:hypothetical protein